ncbi:uncharacterized protein LOC110617251 [Manihot esculenta]|uniref:Uncharacterized protein n=2 Tax=Manihot esculenta TaxID=3983 RepID=A0ACB7GV17_MANES|nr:uncharacterized protein LOC110617251 [Manihot esculenta]KAG8644152.1 hypothetical protein MANES_11G104560v8 [Manihot esculenta]
MTPEVRFRSPSPNGKSRSSLEEKPTDLKTTTNGEKSVKIKRFGEVAGGTAAECAAVCCCCPCTLMNLLVLAIFKMPACICRKAKKRHRLGRKQRSLLVHAGRDDRDGGELEGELQAKEKQKATGVGDDDDDGKTAAVDLEKEMLDRFYATGFWRSPSQRSTSS